MWRERIARWALLTAAILAAGCSSTPFRPGKCAGSDVGIEVCEAGQPWVCTGTGIGPIWVPVDGGTCQE